MTLTKNEHGYYEVRIKGPDGIYKSRSTGKKNKAEAQELVKAAKIAELELAAEMGILSQDVVSVLLTGKRMTVAEAMEPWRDAMERQHRKPRSVANAFTWVTAWAAWGRLEKKTLTSLKAEHFDAWINAEGLQKLGTRRVMLSALRSFCTFCTDNGWMQGNPANLAEVDMSSLPHAQKETLRRPCFDETEVDALIAHTGPNGERPDYFWHSAVIIGRWTGLRLGDIACLEWDSIDTELGHLNVWTQKRDRRVSLSLAPAILKETVDGLDRRHPLFVFPRERDTMLSPARRALLSVQFSRILERCQIQGKSFHCLRATYCTDCDAKGISIDHISRQVGHSNSATTAGYIRPTPDSE